ncbi:MAG: hypothetical protein AB7C97_09580 [Oscillospiraceae bacterium]
MAATIKQGDAYSLPVTVTLDGTALDISDVSIVEFMFGSTRKLYPDTVTYNAADGKFYLPITQEETLALSTGNIKLDIRVKFVNGSVQGIKRPMFATIVDAVSEEVL